MAQCDVHPQRDSRFYLEHHGQCYWLCSLYELDRLVSGVRTGIGGNYTYHTLPACGHSDSKLGGTWPQHFPGIEENDSAEVGKCPQCCHLAHAPHICTSVYPDSRVVCACKVGTSMEASPSVPNNGIVGTPSSTATATMPVSVQVSAPLRTGTHKHPQVSAMSLQAALMEALYAAQDLYNQDHTAQHERWRNWAISWLREITQGNAS